MYWKLHETFYYPKNCLFFLKTVQIIWHNLLIYNSLNTLFYNVQSSQLISGKILPRRSENERESLFWVSLSRLTSLLPTSSSWLDRILSSTYLTYSISKTLIGRNSQTDKEMIGQRGIEIMRGKVRFLRSYEVEEDTLEAFNFKSRFDQNERYQTDWTY